MKTKSIVGISITLINTAILGAALYIIYKDYNPSYLPAVAALAFSIYKVAEETLNHLKSEIHNEYNQNPIITTPLKIKSNHTLKFNIGQQVYLKTDPDQLPRIVDSINLMPNNLVAYRLLSEATASQHYEFEISTEPNVLLNSKY